MVMNFPSGNAIVEMIPETAKLNVNFASAQDLLSVIRAVSGDENKARQITEAILHWRQRGPANPLDSFYLGMGPTFQPRGASLEEIEELLSVRGVTPELFYGNYIAGEQGQLYPRGGLRDCLSVWGSIGPFDVNGASPALLEAIGVNPSDVQRVVAQRTQRPFLDMNEVRGIGVTNPRLRVGGNSMWTLRATARLRRPDGTPSDVLRSASATVKYWSDQLRHPTPVQIVRYYEDAWSEFSIKPGGAQQ
jgi:general secretion pathway protein K